MQRSDLHNLDLIWSIFDLKNSKQFGFWSGLVAAVLAVVSALLSIAPFTPAVVLTAVILPAAVVATWFGAWRLGVFGFYWTLLAIVAFPTVTPTWLEASFGAAYLIGLALGTVLYLQYRGMTASP